MIIGTARRWPTLTLRGLEGAVVARASTKQPFGKVSAVSTFFRLHKAANSLFFRLFWSGIMTHDTFIIFLH